MISAAIGVVMAVLISTFTTWHACRPKPVDRLAGPLFPAGPDPATSSGPAPRRAVDATVILERLAAERGERPVPLGARGVRHAIEAVTPAARARRASVEHQHRVHRLTAPPRLRLVA